MKIIDRYIGRSFIQCFLLVLSMLGFLFSFFEFITELYDVGSGHYQITDALSFVLLTHPGRISQLIPPSSLLGGVIALGLLADNNELVALRANGISVHRICWSVIGAAVIPMIVAGVLAEYIVPPLEQQARTLRLVALTGADITFTASGFWARNGPVFVHDRLELTVSAPGLDGMGMVMDFDDLERLVRKAVLDGWDHATLLAAGNPLAAAIAGVQAEAPERVVELPGPRTAEVMAREAWQALERCVPPHVALVRVLIRETPRCAAVYTRHDAARDH